VTARVEELVRAICDEIESWKEHDLDVHLANDGDGYFDFVGFTVGKDARTRLSALLTKMLKE
jgi:hypothetical protein